LIRVNKFDKQVPGFSDPENFTIIWIEKGIRSLQIDFELFDPTPGSIFFIMPGQEVLLEFESEPAGWIIHFGSSFLKNRIEENLVIKQVDIFSTFSEVPKIILSPKIGERVHLIAEMIDEFAGSEIPNKEAAAASLLKTLLIYCDSKCNIRLNTENHSNDVEIAREYKRLVSRHFTKVHQVSEYADMMNISPRYLNQVVKKVLGVTAKSVIHEQIMIKARRELKFSNDSIKEIAYKLGFCDPFYFSNYFKKMIGCSPSDYRSVKFHISATA